MTREERLKLCKICAHCKRDIQRGMVCGLTNKHADFEGDCSQFVASQYHLTQKQAKTTVSHIEEEGNLPFVLVAVVCIFVFYAFLLAGSTQPIRLLLVIGSILLATALVMLAYGYVKGRKAQQSAPRAIPLNLAILEKILRAEGYSPQKMDDNTIMFKRQGEAYWIHYNEPKFALRYYFPIETDSINAHLVAMWVMENLVMVKVVVRKNSEEPNLQNITLSVEALIDSVDVLHQFFASYVQIIEKATQSYMRGIELMHQYAHEEETNSEPSRREAIYQGEFRWMPNVLFKAVADGQLAPEALTNEDWIRKNIQQGVSSNAAAQEWDSFKINRVDNYGDYKLIIYQFPEPKVIPEAKYGAVLMNTKTLDIDYYTLEMTYNDKWVYGSMSTEGHNNYGEVDTADLNKFIEWIFTKDKTAVAGEVYTKKRQETVN